MQFDTKIVYDQERITFTDSNFRQFDEGSKLLMDLLYRLRI